MEKKVFITQVPSKRDKETGVFSPIINIAPAREHGEIVVMMPSQASFHATSDLIAQLRDKLKDYNYERGDSIIAMGDPAIIAVACSLLAREHGRYLLLKWDKIVHRYLPIHVRFN